jgi:ribosomal protein S18 acetylase RimI-like enzyme
MSVKIELRYARLEQIDELSTLFTSVVQQLDIYSDDARTEEVLKFSSNRLTRRLADDPRSIELAFVDQKMAGFLITEFQYGPIWMHWYGVHQAARGCGVGETLLKHLIATAPSRGATRLWCDTRTNNVQSIELLKKLGFDRLCELKNHWHGQDYYLWSKDLT